jgi:hypothetical protein
MVIALFNDRDAKRKFEYQGFAVARRPSARLPEGSRTIINDTQIGGQSSRHMTSFLAEAASLCYTFRFIGNSCRHEEAKNHGKCRARRHGFKPSKCNS